MSLHVDIVGNGPPLVLLHGWAMHGGIFAPLVEALREHRTLHVVDLPGHGHNRDCGIPLQLEAFARAVLDAVPDAPWCGWSLGGLVALHAASTHPERIPALAMVCATPKFVVAEDWPQGMPKQVFEGFFSSIGQSLQQGVSLWQAFGQAAVSVLDDIANKALQMAAVVSPLATSALASNAGRSLPAAAAGFSPGFSPGLVPATSKPGFSGSCSSKAMSMSVFVPKMSSRAPSTAMAIWFRR